MKKLKNVLIITVLMLCLFAVTSCGKNDSKNVKNEKKDTQVSNEKENVSTNDSSDKDGSTTTAPTGEADKNSSSGKDYEPNFIHDEEPIGSTHFGFVGAELDVKAPAYHEVPHGLQNFHFGEILTIGYFQGDESYLKGIEKNEDIMDKLGETFFRGTERYIDDNGFDHFEFDKQEKVTINGIDMIRYEGNLVVKGYDSNKRYVVAYVFLYNNTPNAIFGCVGDYKQPKEYIEEMRHNVDESVKTIVPWE